MEMLITSLIMVQTSLGTVIIKYTHFSLTIYKTVVNIHYLIGLCLAPAGSLSVL